MTMTRNSKQLGTNVSSKKILTSQDSVPMSNRRFKGDPLFLPDTHDEKTDTETEQSASESEHELSESDGDETSQTNDEIVDILKHLKSQVADSESIRDGMITLNKALTQQRDYLQEQHNMLMEELKNRCDKTIPKRSKMIRFMRMTSTLAFGAVLGVSALVAGAYITIRNEQLE